MLVLHVGMLAGAGGRWSVFAVIAEDQGDDGGVGGGDFDNGHIMDCAAAQDFGGKLPGMAADVGEIHWFGKGTDPRADASLA